MSKIPNVKLDDVLMTLKEKGHDVTGKSYKHTGAGSNVKGLRLRFDNLNLTQTYGITEDVFNMLNTQSGHVGTISPSYNEGTKVLSLDYRLDKNSLMRGICDVEVVKKQVVEPKKQVEPERRVPGCANSTLSSYNF